MSKTWGELLFGKKEHKKQMRRVKEMERHKIELPNYVWKELVMAVFKECEHQLADGGASAVEGNETEAIKNLKEILRKYDIE